MTKARFTPGSTARFPLPSGRASSARGRVRAVRGGRGRGARDDRRRGADRVGARFGAGRCDSKARAGCDCKGGTSCAAIPLALANARCDTGASGVRGNAVGRRRRNAGEAARRSNEWEIRRIDGASSGASDGPGSSGSAQRSKLTGRLARPIGVRPGDSNGAPYVPPAVIHTRARMAPASGAVHEQPAQKEWPRQRCPS